MICFYNDFATGTFIAKYKAKLQVFSKYQINGVMAVWVRIVPK